MLNLVEQAYWRMSFVISLNSDIDYISNNVNKCANVEKLIVCDF